MAAKKKTVFVTGASGFIAKHIVLQLLEKGYSVRGSVRNDAKAKEVTAAVAPHLTKHDKLEDRLTFAVLDLNSDAGWDKALNGCDALLHTASPFPLTEPKEEDDLIRPAVDGTLRALKAAKSAGIDRVILTSSLAAVAYKDTGPDNGVAYDENDWTDLNSRKSTAYVKSKAMAERAAWDFAKENPDLKLTTVNPTLVVGPALDTNIGSSLQLIQRILNRGDPAMPNLALGVVDVRDIAAMHVNALEKPGSAGKRFIGSSGSLWFVDVARIIAARFPDRKVVTRIAPNWLVRIFGLFDSGLRGVIPSLGEELPIDNSAARNSLGIDFISVEDAISASVSFLIKHELVK